MGKLRNSGRRSGRGKPITKTPAHWRGSNVPGRGRTRRTTPGRMRKGSWRSAFRDVRPILLIIALVTLWWIADDPARIGAPDLLATDQQVIDAQFALCDDRGFSSACVVDGDTISIDRQSIRVIGIDTAEKDGLCEAEVVLARQSTRALQEWLNRGPFTIQRHWGEDDRDRYGRLLRVFWRKGANGGRDEAEGWMVTNGGARRYDGGTRAKWC